MPPPLKPVYIILILTTFGLGSSAQKKVPSFGNIDIEDLKMSSCDFDPGAPALRLFDITDVNYTLFYSGESKMKIEQRVRIKIFNEKGYEFASVKIPYISKRGIGKIKELKGIVYTLDSSGRVIKEELEKEDFFKQKVVEYMGVVSFTFPNLKPGSVVEYSYTRVENNIPYIDPWIIQSEIPVKYSSCIITLPHNSLLKEKLFGADSVDRIVEPLPNERPVKKTYFKENVTSFKPEPFMSSQADNLMKMIYFHIPARHPLVSSASHDMDWDDIGTYFVRAKLDSQLQKTLPDTEKLIDSANKITSIQERIRYIYNAVKSQVPKKHEQTYMPKDILETWKNRSGNTADINLILLNLLKKANVICYPLLASTRENGLISKEFPSFSQLNALDVVAMADSLKFYLLDASLKYQSLSAPPLNILNREALLLRPGFIDWFSVEDQRPLLLQNINLFCTLKESGMIEGEASVQHYHYAKEYIQDSTLKEQKRKENKYLDKKTQGLTIISTNQEITADENDPIYETIKFTYEPQHTDNYYFLNPQFLTPQKDNPFISDKRKTDIDLLCNQQMIISINLEIPSAIEIDHLPNNIIVRAPDSSFYYKRSYSFNGTALYLTHIFEVKKAIFPREDYAGIKEFFGRMYTLMNEEIVLKKKK